MANLENKLQLIGSHSGTAFLIDNTSNKIFIKKILAHSSQIRGVSAIKNSKFVTVGEDRWIKIWDIRN